MQKLIFSAGHIFILKKSWSLSMNGVASCGRSLEGLFGHRRLSDAQKTEIKGLIENKKSPAGAGIQLELF